MSYAIEVTTTNKNLLPYLIAAFEPLNKIQNEFHYQIAPERLLQETFEFDRNHFHRSETLSWLEGYRSRGGGVRPFIILVVDKQLSGKNPQSWLFGCHDAEKGFAIFTTDTFEPSQEQFLFDIVRFCRYYLVRYTLNFVNPFVGSHKETRGCMFDFKEFKPDILKSLSTGKICEECTKQLQAKYNQEIRKAVPLLLQVVSGQYPLALVMKGGGVKGLAFAGALEELQSYFSFDTFAGTSAGAISAILLGAGYKPSELLEIMKQTDFNQFKDSCFLQGITNMIFKSGWHSGAKFRDWIDELIKAKLSAKVGGIKMQDMKTRTVVYASSRGHGFLKFNSEGLRRENLAAFAARCSMSIPFFFVPVKVEEYKVYDGGVGNNFPLRTFIEDNPSKLFLGLYLTTTVRPESSIFKDLEDMITDSNEREVVDRHLDKIVLIDPYPIRTKQFNLSETEKGFLVLCGRVGALNYLNEYHKDIKINDARLDELTKLLEEQRSKLINEYQFK